MKNKRYSNFHGKYCTIDNQNYIFAKKSFVTKHQSFYQLEFNIGKDMWKHINHQKIMFKGMKKSSRIGPLYP